MSNNSTSKIAIITGGSHGIGRAVANKLQQEGVQVIVADIRDPEITQEEITFRKCDVTRTDEIDALFEWVQEHYGVPDILILSAGQGVKERLTEGDPEKWQKVINVNLMGPLRCIRSFVPLMLEKRSGHLIFLSSVSANQPHEFGGVYCASKSALEDVAETLRLETYPNLKVTVVSPGIVDTSFFKHQFSDNSGVQSMGMGSISPEEIAEDIWYVLNRKPGSNINKIISRPNNQRF